MGQQEMNIQSVKDLFNAAKRGNLHYVLDHVADNIEWQSPVINSMSVPIAWTKPRHGKEGINAFFQELYKEVTPIEMEPLTFAARDDRVLVAGTMRGMANRTGLEYQTNWMMAFTMRNGKCVRLLHYFDMPDDFASLLEEDLRKAA